MIYYLKCIFLSMQLLILAVDINSIQIFFRGKYFDDEFRNKTESRAGSPVQQYWKLQPVDHFSPSNTKTWYQRYFVNEAYYKKRPNSPIFLMFGGEGAISNGWITGGSWVERAKKLGALLLLLEHRFYGDSHPTDNTTTENLQYLTVEQAFQDAVSFIVSMKEVYNLHKTNRWILFGGAYSGNLVAWFRMKYPYLAYGAISSSAPVISVVDFKDYFKVVAESLGSYSHDCVTTITEAYASIDQLSQDQNGQKSLTTKFNLCEALEDSNDFLNDFAQLNNVLANYIAEVVQYNNWDHLSNKTINNICDILVNKTSGSTSLDRFATLTKILLNSQKATCLEYNYQNFVNYFANTDWKHHANSGGGRQWFFQTCHQLGYFPSSSNTPHVFGDKFPVGHFIKQCTDVFGEQYNAKFIEDQIKNTNNNYGGRDIATSVDRIVFLHGSIDPWHALGVTNSTNSRSPAIYVIGTSHCASMNSYSDQDLPQVIVARQTVNEYIRTWLTQK